MRFAAILVAAAVTCLLGVGHAKAAPPAACFAEWNAGTVYNPADSSKPNEASQYGVNYQANFYTQGDDPETHSGYSGAPWTEVSICHACEVAPAAPTNLTAVATSDTQTDLIWSQSAVPANCQVTKYEIFEGSQKIGVSAGNNFSVSGLAPNTRYRFSVRADDSVGKSDLSTQFAVRTAAAGQGHGPTPVFAPYIDMSQAASENLPSIMVKTGLTHATLAFLIAPSGGGCDAAWGGTVPYRQDALGNGQTVAHLVAKIRGNGGDVIISFGGSAGTDVALSCGTAISLAKLYEGVIKHYNATSLDFDIENGTETDQASLDRRAQALRKIRKLYPALTISYTLPVGMGGLDDNGLNVLTSAKTQGFVPDVVNIMAMDYTVNVDDMGQAAVSAANNTALQIQQNGMAARVGVTPMIGSNDSNIPPVQEIFDFNDAKTVLNFAQPNSDIARLAMWSINRDNGNCPGQQKADATCSGLQQRAYTFIKVFKAFGPQ